MSDDLTVQVHRGRNGVTRVYINSQELPVDRIDKVEVDLLPGFTDSGVVTLHLIPSKTEFLVEDSYTGMTASEARQKVQDALNK